MLDYTQEGISNEEILKVLKDKRLVKYEYAVINKDGYTIGFLQNGSGYISFDSSREIMRTGTFTFKRTELLDINTVDERIKPYFCIQVQGKWLRYPLGVFVIEKDENLDRGSVYVDATGYDLGLLVKEDKINERHYISAGSIYTNQLEAMLQEVLKNTKVSASTLSLNIDLEYEMGEIRLSIINELLKGINYNPLHFDCDGVAICDAYIFPELKETDILYVTDQKSIIRNGIRRGNNAFEVPNKFIRYTENVDGNYLKSTYINDNPDSIISTVNRGRIISDIGSVSNIASQNELDMYTKRIAIEKTQTIETITFKTMNMPGHDYKNCLYVKCEEAGIEGKYIESGWEMELAPGGSMTHKCRKVVSL